jgi:hypothetical protein
LFAQAEYVFALDGVLLATLWLYLSRLRVGRDAIQTDERVPWLSGLLVGIKSQPPGGLMQAGIWRRAHYRRLMGLGRRFVWIIAACVALLIASTPLVYSTKTWFVHGDYAFAALVTAGIISALCVGLSWPQRFAELSEVELLRPAPRQDCAREIGLAMLSDAAELSFATIAAMLLPIAFWSPNMLQTAVFWNAVAAGILAQALTFGLLVWTMLLRSAAATMGALVLSILALTTLLYYAMDDRTLVPSMAAGAMGVLLTVSAYRRWLRADMM